MDSECSSLLDELQTIWNDVGETDAEKDVMLLELEQECLEIYRRKVVQANGHRTQLRQSIVDSEAEIVTICSALGETPVHFRQNKRSLKEELKFITTQLEGMRERRNRRLGQFLEVAEQIHCITKEISPENSPSEILLDEHDLSLRKLEDLQKQLDLLQKEKNDRLGKVVNHLNTLNSMCLVLDIDFKETLVEVHPSLNEPGESKSISNSTIEKLVLAIQRLREVKLQRMHKLQDLASTILEMWHLMDTPFEEQEQFQDVTCNIAASEQEITEPNSLSLGFINRVEEEVRRLEGVKASKMKDLVLKKKLELDELCRRTHLVEPTNLSTLSAVEGSIDPFLLLGQIEAQISIVKEEAFSRKEILEKVEKWLAACEEESWLEEYNRDENRYNAGKGAHLTLKRAEKARATVGKIPGIVENLTTKVMAWENERGIEFLYNGIEAMQSSLLCMLEEYINLRQEKEQERKRQRDQRRLHGQLMAEQGLLLGSKPSPSKPVSTKKLTKALTGRSTKRQSVSFQPLKHDSLSSADDFSASGPGGEDETPRMPFTPLGQPCSIPSTPPQTTMHDAEEENKTHVFAAISGQKTPMEFYTPMQMTPVLAQDVALKIAPQNLEMSVEERRLEVLQGKQ